MSKWNEAEAWLAQFTRQGWAEQLGHALTEHVDENGQLRMSRRAMGHTSGLGYHRASLAMRDILREGLAEAIAPADQSSRLGILYQLKFAPQEDATNATTTNH